MALLLALRAAEGCEYEVIGPNTDENKIIMPVLSISVGSTPVLYVDLFAISAG